MFSLFNKKGINTSDKKMEIAQVEELMDIIEHFEKGYESIIEYGLEPCDEAVACTPESQAKKIIARDYLKAIKNLMENGEIKDFYMVSSFYHRDYREIKDKFKFHNAFNGYGEFTDMFRFQGIIVTYEDGEKELFDFSTAGTHILIDEDVDKEKNDQNTNSRNLFSTAEEIILTSLKKENISDKVRKIVLTSFDLVKKDSKLPAQVEFVNKEASVWSKKDQAMPASIILPWTGLVHLIPNYSKYISEYKFNLKLKNQSKNTRNASVVLIGPLNNYTNEKIRKRYINEKNAPSYEVNTNNNDDTSLEKFADEIVKQKKSPEYIISFDINPANLKEIAGVFSYVQEFAGNNDKRNFVVYFDPRVWAAMQSKELVKYCNGKLAITNKYENVIFVVPTKGSAEIKGDRLIKISNEPNKRADFWIKADSEDEAVRRVLQFVFIRQGITQETFPKIIETLKKKYDASKPLCLDMIQKDKIKLNLKHNFLNLKIETFSENKYEKETKLNHWDI